MNEQAQRENVGVVPVVQEEVHIAKNEKEVAQVVVHVTPHVKREQIRVPVERRAVEIERVAVNREVDVAPSVRQEGDVTIIPIFEEVLVVQKKLIVKEEIHIRQRRTVEEEVHEVALRSEEAHILRSDNPEKKT